ncbi:related to Putative oxidoreductase C1F5.03c [Ramularia collo-cygni]|uniref:Related to Putative oxidoreductase C1F5.03c n=1 Tax=Ramularia collo-cygni TaxID=112498 RepID=A0A2D3V2Z5_9PEZI|nr:related to Putative oxidoreductase C1F5.03c [Ramularia collo-cygni]CZT19840.1 related to Putative oxidoreductase C1F5.03c [Ramularia collo-cygni]
MTADGQKNIVIIGGGIIGCTSAYFLTRHPSYDPKKHKITLLEATKIAGGASGKAGGLLALWAYPSSLVPLSYRLHKQLSDEHNGEERWGYRAVHCGQVDCIGRNTAAKSVVHGKNGDMSGDNGEVAESVSLQKRSKEAMSKLRKAGVPEDLDWVSSESLRRYEEMGDPSTTAQVHPFQFTTSVADLAQEKGAEIKTEASVKQINFTADGESVESVTYTQNGQDQTLPATDIILAAGPWTRSVYPSAPIGAMRAHSVTIKPSRPVSAFALFTQIKLPSTFTPNPSHSGQFVTPEIYARPRNEVYACGEGDHAVPLPPTSQEVEVDEQRCQEVVDFVSSISDELRDGEVTARQACYLPSVVGSNAPLVGPTGVNGLWMAAGHTCWGINNGPATGKIVSEFVFDGEKGVKCAKVKGLDPREYL